MEGFKWDPIKELLNIAKHGVSFTTASAIWDGPTSERPDNRRNYGEPRFVAFGIAEDRVLAVVYTPRGTVCRIISARIADRWERRLYEDEIARRRRTRPD